MTKHSQRMTLAPNAEQELGAGRTSQADLFCLPPGDSKEVLAGDVRTSQSSIASTEEGSLEDLPVWGPLSGAFFKRAVQAMTDRRKRLSPNESEFPELPWVCSCFDNTEYFNYRNVFSKEDRYTALLLIALSIQSDGL